MFMLNSPLFSQVRITVEEYISEYKELAIEEMIDHHIPASITLAQGILESECGNSPLAREANNHFGIKCHKEWTGETFFQDDDEKNECFRRYRKPEESYRDHSDFLVTRDRYNLLFDLGAGDYKAWAYGLKQAGYATNPRYPELLIKIIEENGLSQFDEAGSRQSSVISDDGNSKTNNSKTPDSELKTQNSELTIAGRGGNGRVIYSNNGVKFILARAGDDFSGIAEEFNIYSWQVWMYNDLLKDDKLLPGQKVYLEKKKGMSKSGSHTVRSGESLYSISQDYGIRLKALTRINGKKPDWKPAEGDLIRLK
jgi:LysM repeat protein